MQENIIIRFSTLFLASTKCSSAYGYILTWKLNRSNNLFTPKLLKDFYYHYIVIIIIIIM